MIHINQTKLIKEIKKTIDDKEETFYFYFDEFDGIFNWYQLV